MTREEREKAIVDIRDNIKPVVGGKSLDMAIEALDQEPCEDAISRQAVLNQIFYSTDNSGDVVLGSALRRRIDNLPSVKPQELKTGYCKDCKYFEYDSMAMVDGIPIIVAHEICSKWGDGCKTKEDGYCFLFEPQERSDKK